MNNNLKRNSDNICVIHSRAYHKSAGGVVVCKNNKTTKIALLQWKEKNGWTLPKGHIKTKEAIRDAARREVQEELGVACCPFPIKKIAVEYIIFKLPKDSHIHYKQTHIYLFIFEKEYKLTPNKKEHFINAKWISLNRAERVIKQSPFIANRYLKVGRRIIRKNTDKYIIATVKNILKKHYNRPIKKGAVNPHNMNKTI